MNSHFKIGPFIGIIILLKLSVPRIFAQGIDTKSFRSNSGNTYTMYLLGKNNIEFTTQFPSKQNKNILFCIAAAFTKDSGVDGVYGVEGKIFNQDKINHRVGGALKITQGKVEFVNTKKGKIFTKNYLNQCARQQASFFQQLYLIVNGTPEVSKSEKTFQCRGVAKLKTGELCVIESEKEITLATFAKDVSKIVQELIYTDMGSWDEGWYRNKEGKISRIGSIFLDTDKQTNWIVFTVK